MEQYILQMSAGALGQCVRVIAGMKKMVERGEEFDGVRFIHTLLMGCFIGGASGLVANDPAISFMAGYAGTDFIEGMITKHK